MHIRSGPDGQLSREPALARWTENVVRAGAVTGKTFEIAENMAGLIREAGFEGVVEKRFRWPIGTWSDEASLRELGRWNLMSWEEGMEGWVLAPYTRALGVS